MWIRFSKRVKNGEGKIKIKKNEPEVYGISWEQLKPAFTWKNRRERERFLAVISAVSLSVWNGTSCWCGVRRRRLKFLLLARCGPAMADGIGSWHLGYHNYGFALAFLLVSVLKNGRLKALEEGRLASVRLLPRMHLSGSLASHRSIGILLLGVLNIMLLEKYY